MGPIPYGGGGVAGPGAYIYIYIFTNKIIYVSRSGVSAFGKLC